MTDRTLLVNQICLIAIWASTSFCYYLLSQFLRFLKGDIFTNGIIGSFAEGLGIVSSLFLLRRVGLKTSFIISYLIMTFGMLCMMFVDTNQQFWISTFLLSSKFGVASAFCLSYVANQKLFPVSVLATSIGICNIFARLVTISSSFVAELKPEILPMSLFVVFSLLALVATLNLKIKTEKKW